MRSKKDNQGVLDFRPATLSLTVEHYTRYEQIDQVLKSERGVLDLVHKDLEKALENENRERDRRCQYTSEAETFRGITVRIDDSNFFRRFTGIHDKDMMNFTTLNGLANHITPATWKKMNDLLARHAVANSLIEGEKLRLDTTAVETNIHWPTDSSLLWDVYRVLARFVDKARALEPIVVGSAKLQLRRAKKLHTTISREASKKSHSNPKLKSLYEAFLGLVGSILALSKLVADRLEKNEKKRDRCDIEAFVSVSSLVAQLRHFSELGDRVADQARRRVLCEEQVPNDEKLFSIFETHTELLKRGKAGKPIEFGHMVLLQQVDGKFICSRCGKTPRTQSPGTVHQRRPNSPASKSASSAPSLCRTRTS